MPLSIILQKDVSKSTKMTGNNCLLDTSIIIHSFRNSEYAKQTLSKFDKLFVNSIVTGELYYGAYFSPNPQKHITQIEAFLINCSAVYLTDDTAVIYAQLKSDLRKKAHRFRKMISG